MKTTSLTLLAGLLAVSTATAAPTADDNRGVLNGPLTQGGHKASGEGNRESLRLAIEDLMETLMAFKAEGKIGGIGFSEISPATLRRAAAAGIATIV